MQNPQWLVPGERIICLLQFRNHVTFVTLSRSSLRKVVQRSHDCGSLNSFPTSSASMTLKIRKIRDLDILPRRYLRSVASNQTTFAKEVFFFVFFSPLFSFSQVQE